MFVIDCPKHQSRVLLPQARIRHLTNTRYGIVLDLECWCGEHVALLTGRRSGAEDTVTTPPRPAVRVELARAA